MNVRLIAIAAAFAGIAAAPAAAAQVDCQQTPAQIRTLAGTAQADQAAKAVKLVSLGEKLCAADNRWEAGKKFSAAAKVLGTDVAQLTATPTGGQ